MTYLFSVISSMFSLHAVNNMNICFFDKAMFVFLAHLSHSDREGNFCDWSLSMVRRHPLTIDLNDNFS